MLFYALRLCDDVGNMLLDQPPTLSESHPSNQERIEGLFSFAEMVAPAGDVRAPLEEALSYLCVFGSQAKLALFRGSSDREPDDGDILERLRLRREWRD
jgi:hypothetical protein